MTCGSRVKIVNPDSEYFGRYGNIERLTSIGLVVVQLEGETGPLWRWTFHPQEVELSAPIKWYWQARTDYVLRHRED